MKKQDAVNMVSKIIKEVPPAIPAPGISENHNVNTPVMPEDENNLTISNHPNPSADQSPVNITNNQTSLLNYIPEDVVESYIDDVVIVSRYSMQPGAPTRKRKSFVNDFEWHNKAHIDSRLKGQIVN